MASAREATGARPTCVSASGLVPIFPLPGVVFFPRTVLALHVFEPRYRAMVRDALEGERLIAIALLQPGWERDYERQPAFHGVGCVGRMEDVEPLPDGRFHLRLVGLQRLELGEVVRSNPYRVARVSPLPEVSVDEADPRVIRAKLDLLASHGCLVHELAEPGSRGVVLDESLPFEAAINGACANLPLDPAIRQSLLEEDDLMRRHRRAVALLDEVLERVLRLKALRSGDDGTSGIN